MAYVRSVLELLARDREVAEAIAQAASAEDAQRAAAVQKANLTIKAKSSPRMAAPREEVVQEITDVVPAGKFIKITIKRCKTDKDGNKKCWEITIEL